MCANWSISLRPILRYAIIPHAKIIRIYTPIVLLTLLMDIRFFLFSVSCSFVFVKAKNRHNYGKDAHLESYLLCLS
jgi:hypothetical protein